MADPIEEPHPDDLEEEGGGPVKTFLEHLEDLRWTLIKSGAALLVGMIVCLYATDKIIAVLKWPLEEAALLPAAGHKQKAMVRFGGREVFSFESETNRIGPLDLGSNRLAIIHIEPVAVGTNVTFTGWVETNPPESVLLANATALVYLDPGAPFMASLHLAFFAGILLAAPFIIFFWAQFILPALKLKEKKYFLRAFGIGVGLFFLGVSICYFLILKRALQFAVAFAHWMGVSVPMWRAETYFSFVTKFMLGMGLGFELPVVLLALVKIGVLDYQKLASMRRYMIVINLILGALLTTPEWFTQVVMAIALQILFEISVWIAWYWERQEKKREAAEERG